MDPVNGCVFFNDFAQDMPRGHQMIAKISLNTGLFPGKENFAQKAIFGRPNPKPMRAWQKRCFALKWQKRKTPRLLGIRVHAIVRHFQDATSCVVFGDEPRSHEDKD